MTVLQNPFWALKNGLTQMGLFGGGHTDDMDLAAGLSVMVEGSHLPDDYEAGEFHLLSLGVYWVLVPLWDTTTSTIWVHICLQVKLCANANVAGVKYECRRSGCEMLSAPPCIQVDKAAVW
ncbi:uncharacterized protein B0H18DRAFT_958213 [Fomitopsis serialis]|uniref:uncharacterized protein n=1 Tax=Fomitopsis serialis TaxID=139415 RepID=UPI00200818ED|nr:uncharacterized protein B0H18DRAFT_958213 [Neoantrodia serialis]KAH9917774.1 hypothetical protein B0H18DRAFT_958213 [Neoantrodia serialis]